MQLIESYSDDSSLWEDDDGFRIFFSESGEVPPNLIHEETISVVVNELTHTWVVYNDDGEPLGEGEGEFHGYLDAVAQITAPLSGFVHLHTHSEFSGLDGLSTTEEMVARAVADGQTAIAVTDHGTCAAHPHLQEVAQKAGIKAIFGIEGNLVEDRLRRPLERPKGLTAEEKVKYDEDLAEVKDYWHIILWAMNDVGLRNLWAMSTEANRDGFYYRPRMDWATLEKYSEGVMCSTACLRGPISTAILDGDSDAAVMRLGRLMDIFPDRLYVELHTNHLTVQFGVNEALVKMARDYDLPMIAVSDSHYSCEEHADAHKVWIAAQTNSTLTDETGLFEGDQDYHIMTRQEVEEALDYLPPRVIQEAIENTVKVADRCNAELTGNPTPPVFSKRGGAAKDVELLVDQCVRNWSKTKGKAHSEQEYMDRFEREMNLLKAKDLCGYFLIVADYCMWAKAQGILVGPGRGSGGGSLVAYLCGIIEVDPVDAELLFERFLTPGRKDLPDFDVDFPSRRIDEVLQYIIDKWGEDSVVRVGTHVRLKNKGVIRDLARVLKNTITIDYVDIDNICKIVDKAEASSAGLGVSWDTLMLTHGTELQKYWDKYPDLYRYASILVGRLKSYGKHAAGVIIDSGEGSLVDKLPLRMAGDRLVSEFDMDALAMLGLVKFDFLGLRTLDTIQDTLDLIKERHGKTINVYEWREEFEDPNVWQFLSEGNTLGVFQIETTAGTMVTKALLPKNLHDMADVITLDRPGPQRSGLDKQYLDRRHGRAAVSFIDPRLEKVLHRTHGVMMYQEDIMSICRVLGGYSEDEAEKMRKVLGKKKIDLVDAEGRKFLPACIEGGVPKDVANKLWDQMKEFSLYAFNKSHAYAYGMIAYWCAWFRYHYPVEFYTGAMSTVDKDRVPEFVVDAKRQGFQVLPPDINESGKGFRASGNVIRYGLDAVNGIGNKAVDKIVAGQPYASFEDYLERSNDMGITKLLVAIGAFDSMVPNRKWLEHRVALLESGIQDRCVNWNPEQEGAPNGLPCTFDWESEPAPIGKRGLPLKKKPVPKQCTVRCRNYVKRPPVEVPEPVPYTEKEIREIEMELIGIYLSSSPFDVLDRNLTKEEQKQLATLHEVDSATPGSETSIAAIVKEARRHTDRNGNEMAFLNLIMRDGELNAVAFSGEWTKCQRLLNKGSMVLAVVRKTDRGVTLKAVMPT